ncbi:hypothetical protein [Azospirillum thermophilum]|uniref:hypothetical protein n=1 Tax=Azospirillum thermophilum TaxID=2202148 RepID=UPI00143DC650|nr:hypothetical protein [Azospirillum thermophilum]
MLRHHRVHAELGSLKAELERLAVARPDPPLAPEPSAGQELPSEPPPEAPSGTEAAEAAEAAEAGRLLAELRDTLSDAGGEAEAVIARHPLAAVAGAFLLGIAVGRVWGVLRS